MAKHVISIIGLESPSIVATFLFDSEEEAFKAFEKLAQKFSDNTVTRDELDEQCWQGEEYQIEITHFPMSNTLEEVDEYLWDLFG